MILKAIYYLKMCNIKGVNLLSIKKPPKKKKPTSVLAFLFSIGQIIHQT